MQPPWSQLVRNAFYTKVKDKENEWKCKRGAIRKQSSTGYAIFTSHGLLTLSFLSLLNMRTHCQPPSEGSYRHIYFEQLDIY